MDFELTKDDSKSMKISSPTTDEPDTNFRSTPDREPMIIQKIVETT